MIEPSGAALFRILGPVEVWTGEGWSSIGAGKQRSVLATLLLRPGEPVSLDTLIDEVWPDRAPARAANLVSVYVHHLRRLIGDTGSPGRSSKVASTDRCFPAPMLDQPSPVHTSTGPRMRNRAAPDGSITS